MLKDPLTVIYDDIDAKLGNPEDIKNVLENLEKYDLKKSIEITGKSVPVK